MSLALRKPALALLAIALPLTAQQPAAPTLHLDTRLVTVALNVTDDHGAPVPNLTAADFILTDNNLPQRIAFFDQASTTTLDIVLAIDDSASLVPYEHLERAAAHTFLHSLVRSQDRIALIAFSDNVDQLTAFTSNPRRIDTALHHIHPGHATALYDALSFASQRLAETPSTPNARRVIVLITDGENTTHHGTYASALEAAQRAGAMVYSLIIVPVAADAGRDTGGEHALIQLATDTGGKYYDVQQQRDLAPALEHVSADLRTQYSLGYYAPPPTAASPPLRHIHLQLDNPTLRARYTLRYRTAYYATGYATAQP
jgi:Ca-activated chloride channel family protein